MVIPKQYATTTLRGSKWMVRVKFSSSPENIWFITVTISMLTPSPSTTPTAAETIA